MASNKATEAWSLAASSLRRGDMAGIENKIHAAVVRIDRRGLGAPTTYSRADVLAAASELVSGVGFDGWETYTVELRGDLHALTGVLWKTKAGYEVEWLQVIEVDHMGRIVRLVYFDTERQSDAIEELDARSRGEAAAD